LLAETKEFKSTGEEQKSEVPAGVGTQSAPFRLKALGLRSRDCESTGVMAAAGAAI
jgi:hypothetical protein